MVVYYYNHLQYLLSDHLQRLDKQMICLYVMCKHKHIYVWYYYHTRLMYSYVRSTYVVGPYHTIVVPYHSSIVVGTTQVMSHVTNVTPHTTTIEGEDGYGTHRTIPYHTIQVTVW
jgi:hypothetical protein